MYHSSFWLRSSQYCPLPSPGTRPFPRLTGYELNRAKHPSGSSTMPTAHARSTIFMSIFSLCEIVVYHGTQAERQVGLDMYARNHFEDRQRRDRRKCMMEKLDRGWPFPRAFDRDVLAEV